MNCLVIVGFVVVVVFNGYYYCFDVLSVCYKLMVFRFCFFVFRRGFFQILLMTFLASEDHGKDSVVLAR